ncbi:MAG: hypothetical protein LH614_14915 [Pyrinomonadaceae bacterium]|nr:hypothetical protein [Pyrinomonadaceae bacterium]
MKTIIYKFLFGIIYTVGYFFLAVLSTGGGHGNFYLLSPALPWLLLFIAIFLLGKLNDLQMRIFFCGVMAVHYGLLIFLLSNYSFSEDRGWSRYGLPYVPIIWYLAGQAIIWAIFFSEMIKGERKIDV